MGINGQRFGEVFDWPGFIWDLLAFSMLIQLAYHAVMWIASHVRIV